MGIYGIRITAEAQYFQNPAISRLCEGGYTLRDGLDRYFKSKPKLWRGVKFNLDLSGETGKLEIMAIGDEEASATLDLYQHYLSQACIGVGKGKHMFSVHMIQ